MEYKPLPIPGGIAAPQGFKAVGVQAGIKIKDKYDLAVIGSDNLAEAAGVYTRNRVKAHPLLLTRAHLGNGKAQAVVVNSGNANACVGEKGDRAALEMAKTTAAGLNIAVEDVIVASTGVIGVELPLEPVRKGIGEATALLRGHGDAADPYWQSEQAHRAALAIMTTDTEVKELAYELKCSRGLIRVGAMAKGSGMIHPNMGTMLGFITTDACVGSAALQALLRETADESFNMVTVDGDTSTNDMVTVLANGASGVIPEGEDWALFSRLFREVCIELAKAIACDGEGATKFLEVKVEGASTVGQARKIAKSICGSSLVKTAMYGEDANWGRILAAAGYAGVDFDPDRIDVCLGPLPVAEKGKGIPFSEEEAKRILKNRHIPIGVHLHEGKEEATAWGCDLTHGYVEINGSYRT